MTDALSALRGAFDPVPGYLNVATMGLPPRAMVAALHSAVEEWRRGEASTARYDESVAVSRRAYAELVGVRDDQVAVGTQVSALLAPIAAAVPDNAEVLLPRGDFSSLVFPFLVQRDRGVSVRQVPLHALAEEIGPGTGVVAFSVVQSADGRLADVAGITEAAARHGALTVADLTQAAGWLPCRADVLDVTVCAAYKWLCSPRGAAFLTLQPSPVSSFGTEWPRPLAAGWYAGESVWESIYGPEMNLAAGARRFDVSPAWLAWVGAAQAVPLFAAAEPGAVQTHDVTLAARLRAELDQVEDGSAIVSIPDPDGARLASLEAAGCVVARRAGRIRLGFHIWNGEDDLDRIVDAVLSQRVGDRDA